MPPLLLCRFHGAEQTFLSADQEHVARGRRHKVRRVSFLHSALNPTRAAPILRAREPTTQCHVTTTVAQRSHKQPGHPHGVVTGIRHTMDHWIGSPTGVRERYNRYNEGGERTGNL